MNLDRIYIIDKGTRAKFRWVVTWTAHTLNPTGQPLPAYDRGEPAGFTGRGDAEIFADVLAGRLQANLGHQVERIWV